MLHRTQSCAFLLLTLLSASAARTQERPHPDDVHVNSDMTSSSAVQAALSPVTGQPYAATKVTHSEWKLADGTRITHDSSTQLARDSAGRVREALEERRATSMGGQQSNRTEEMITIADPVDHSMLMISDPKSKLALRMPVPNLSRLAGMPRTPGGGIPAVRMGTPAPRSASSDAGIATAPRAGNNIRTEDIGQQSLGGVVTTGKRTTTTIPTGEIGNDRPIVIVHEEWYSPDLQLVLKSLDSDPRSGDGTMELQGLTRADPDPALFKAPEGYTVRDMDLFKSLLPASSSKP